MSNISLIVLVCMFSVLFKPTSSGPVAAINDPEYVSKNDVKNESDYNKKLVQNMFSIFFTIPNGFDPNEDSQFKIEHKKPSVICWTHIVTKIKNYEGKTVDQISEYAISFESPTNPHYNYVVNSDPDVYGNTRTFFIAPPEIIYRNKDHIVEKNKYITCSFSSQYHKSHSKLPDGTVEIKIVRNNKKLESGRSLNNYDQKIIGTEQIPTEESASTINVYPEYHEVVKKDKPAVERMHSNLDCNNGVDKLSNDNDAADMMIGRRRNANEEYSAESLHEPVTHCAENITEKATAENKHIPTTIEPVNEVFRINDDVEIYPEVFPLKRVELVPLDDLTYKQHVYCQNISSHITAIRCPVDIISIPLINELRLPYYVDVQYSDITPEFLEANQIVVVGQQQCYLFEIVSETECPEDDWILTIYEPYPENYPDLTELEAQKEDYSTAKQPTDATIDKNHIINTPVEITENPEIHTTTNSATDKSVDSFLIRIVKSNAPKEENNIMEKCLEIDVNVSVIQCPLQASLLPTINERILPSTVILNYLEDTPDIDDNKLIVRGDVFCYVFNKISEISCPADELFTVLEVDRVPITTITGTTQEIFEHLQPETVIENNVLEITAANKPKGFILRIAEVKIDSSEEESTLKVVCRYIDNHIYEQNCPSEMPDLPYFDEHLFPNHVELDHIDPLPEISDKMLILRGNKYCYILNMVNTTDCPSDPTNLLTLTILYNDNVDSFESSGSSESPESPESGSQQKLDPDNSSPKPDNINKSDEENEEDCDYESDEKERDKIQNTTTISQEPKYFLVRLIDIISFDKVAITCYNVDKYITHLNCPKTSEKIPEFDVEKLPSDTVILDEIGKEILLSENQMIVKGKGYCYALTKLNMEKCPIDGQRRMLNIIDCNIDSDSRKSLNTEPINNLENLLNTGFPVAFEVMHISQLPNIPTFITTTCENIKNHIGIVKCPTGFFRIPIVNESLLSKYPKHAYTNMPELNENMMLARGQRVCYILKKMGKIECPKDLNKIVRILTHEVIKNAEPRSSMEYLENNETVTKRLDETTTSTTSKPIAEKPRSSTVYLQEIVPGKLHEITTEKISTSSETTKETVFGEDENNIFPVAIKVLHIPLQSNISSYLTVTCENVNSNVAIIDCPTEFEQIPILNDQLLSKSAKQIIHKNVTEFNANMLLVRGKTDCYILNRVGEIECPINMNKIVKIFKSHVIQSEEIQTSTEYLQNIETTANKLHETTGDISSTTSRPVEKEPGTLTKFLQDIESNTNNLYESTARMSSTSSRSLYEEPSSMKYLQDVEATTNKLYENTAKIPSTGRPIEDIETATNNLHRTTAKIISTTSKSEEEKPRTSTQYLPSIETTTRKLPEIITKRFSISNRPFHEEPETSSKYLQDITSTTNKLEEGSKTSTEYLQDIETTTNKLHETTTKIVSISNRPFDEEPKTSVKYLQDITSTTSKLEEEEPRTSTEYLQDIETTENKLHETTTKMPSTSSRPVEEEPKTSTEYLKDTETTTNELHEIATKTPTSSTPIVEHPKTSTEYLQDTESTINELHETTTKIPFISSRPVQEQPSTSIEYQEDIELVTNKLDKTTTEIISTTAKPTEVILPKVENASFPIVIDILHISPNSTIPTHLTVTCENINSKITVINCPSEFQRIPTVNENLLPEYTEQEFHNSIPEMNENMLLVRGKKVCYIFDKIGRIDCPEDMSKIYIHILKYEETEPVKPLEIETTTTEVPTTPSESSEEIIITDEETFPVAIQVDHISTHSNTPSYATVHCENVNRIIDVIKCPKAFRMIPVIDIKLLTRYILEIIPKKKPQINDSMLLVRGNKGCYILHRTGAVNCPENLNNILKIAMYNSTEYLPNIDITTETYNPASVSENSPISDANNYEEITLTESTPFYDSKQDGTSTESKTSTGNSKVNEASTTIDDKITSEATTVKVDIENEVQNNEDNTGSILHTTPVSEPTTIINNEFVTKESIELTTVVKDNTVQSTTTNIPQTHQEETTTSKSVSESNDNLAITVSSTTEQTTIDSNLSSSESSTIANTSTNEKSTETVISNKIIPTSSTNVAVSTSVIEHEVTEMSQPNHDLTTASTTAGPETTSPNATGINSAIVTETASPNETKISTRNVTETISSTVTESTSPFVTESTSPFVTETTSLNITETTSPTVTQTANLTITEATSLNVTEISSPTITETSSPVVNGTTSATVSEITSPTVTETISKNVTGTTNPIVTETSSPISNERSSPNITEKTSPIITETSSSTVTEITNPAVTESSPISTQTTSAIVAEITSPTVTETISPTVTETTSTHVTETTSAIVTETSPNVTEITSSIATETTTPISIETTSTIVNETTSPNVTETTSPVVTEIYNPNVTQRTIPIVTEVNNPNITETNPTVTEKTSPNIMKTTSSNITETTSPTVIETASPVLTEINNPKYTETTSPFVSEISSPNVTEPTSPILTETTSPIVTEISSPNVTETTIPFVTEISSPNVTETSSAIAIEITSPNGIEITSQIVTEKTSPIVTEIASPVGTETTNQILTEKTSPIITEITSPVGTETISQILTEKTSPFVTEKTSAIIPEITSPISFETTSPIVTEITSPVVTETATPIVSETSPSVTKTIRQNINDKITEYTPEKEIESSTEISTSEPPNETTIIDSVTETKHITTISSTETSGLPNDNVHTTASTPQTIVDNSRIISEKLTTPDTEKSQLTEDYTERYTTSYRTTLWDDTFSDVIDTSTTNYEITTTVETATRNTDAAESKITTSEHTSASDIESTDNTLNADEKMNTEKESEKDVIIKPVFDTTTTDNSVADVENIITEKSTEHIPSTEKTVLVHQMVSSTNNPVQNEDTTNSLFSNTWKEENTKYSTVNGSSGNNIIAEVNENPTDSDHELKTEHKEPVRVENISTLPHTTIYEHVTTENSNNKVASSEEASKDTEEEVDDDSDDDDPEIDDDLAEYLLKNKLHGKRRSLKKKGRKNLRFPKFIGNRFGYISEGHIVPVGQQIRSNVYYNTESYTSPEKMMGNAYAYVKMHSPDNTDVTKTKQQNYTTVIYKSGPLKLNSSANHNIHEAIRVNHYNNYISRQPVILTFPVKIINVFGPELTQMVCKYVDKNIKLINMSTEIANLPFINEELLPRDVRIEYINELPRIMGNNNLLVRGMVYYYLLKEYNTIPCPEDTNNFVPITMYYYGMKPTNPVYDSIRNKESDFKVLNKLKTAVGKESEAPRINYNDNVMNSEISLRRQLTKFDVKFTIVGLSGNNYTTCGHIKENMTVVDEYGGTKTMSIGVITSKERLYYDTHVPFELPKETLAIRSDKGLWYIFWGYREFKCPEDTSIFIRLTLHFDGHLRRAKFDSPQISYFPVKIINVTNSNKIQITCKLMESTITQINTTLQFENVPFMNISQLPSNVIINHSELSSIIIDDKNILVFSNGIYYILKEYKTIVCPENIDNFVPIISHQNDVSLSNANERNWKYVLGETQRTGSAFQQSPTQHTNAKSQTATLFHEIKTEHDPEIIKPKLDVDDELSVIPLVQEENTQPTKDEIVSVKRQETRDHPLPIVHALNPSKPEQVLVSKSSESYASNEIPESTEGPMLPAPEYLSAVVVKHNNVENKEECYEVNNRMQVNKIPCPKDTSTIPHVINPEFMKLLCPKRLRPKLKYMTGLGILKKLNMIIHDPSKQKNIN